MVSPEQIPAVSRVYRLQWEESQQSFVLLYPEGMVQLNGSAGEIMAQVDGVKSVADVIAALEAKFPEAGDLSADILEFLEIARDKHWITIS
ncbi:pyrroloquinoline quinone biosynthesis peptide chaperone PqqD [Parathalassolituus penaei]|uniref:PqqA binding protein n=1 Tax=Parathalassolituus penaei TaxID=2997323 RepID=A0A9X3EAP3_9GAMM|nr:pyrroloquinoline quinone biosynthesis peptide chaperone PqqD [Parathalassolituus penaei]MCY0963705.1 pyrroloquinoline quinone biosynthesis peptide chaperone PqqD [Parathalassolituus penaei]